VTCFVSRFGIKYITCVYCVVYVICAYVIVILLKQTWVARFKEYTFSRIFQAILQIPSIMKFRTGNPFQMLCFIMGGYDCLYYQFNMTEEHDMFLNITNFQGILNEVFVFIFSEPRLGQMYLV
jgi:hypothetical protein